MLVSHSRETAEDEHSGHTPRSSWTRVGPRELEPKRCEQREHHGERPHVIRRVGTIEVHDTRDRNQQPEQRLEHPKEGEVAKAQARPARERDHEHQRGERELDERGRQQVDPPWAVDDHEHDLAHARVVVEEVVASAIPDRRQPERMIAVPRDLIPIVEKRRRVERLHEEEQPRHQDKRAANRTFSSQPHVGILTVVRRHFR